MTNASNDLAAAREHLAAGGFNEAEKACGDFLLGDPRNSEGLALMGSIQVEQGRLDKAIQMFDRAVAVNPGNSELHTHLGAALRSRRRMDQAIAHLETAIRLDPDNVKARYELGLVLLNTHRYQDAVIPFEEALKIKPDYAEAANGLGVAYRLIGHLEESVVQHARALQLQPDFVDAHVSMAIALKKLGKVEQAIELCRTALRLDPDHVMAHNNLGFALILMGKFDEAVSVLEAALRLNPNTARTYQNLGELARQNQYQFSSDQLERVKSLLADRRVSPDGASNLYFTLAGSQSMEGDYDRAFDSYRQANNIRQRILEEAGNGFDASRHRYLVDATIATFGKTFFEQSCRWGLDTETPIFIVGMPRSGTTLVEQIISSHPEAAGAGELRDIQELVPELESLIGRGIAYPACVPHADANIVRDLAQHYEARIAECGAGARRVVDKMWMNFLYLGLIAMMFPKARIIHCRRDVMDVCISCYATNFNDIYWACRFEDIGFFYRQYERLMRHWQEVLPMRVYELSYEQLVGNQEMISRELIAFCGLDWHDGCLEFYHGDGAVRTASAVQVRQPMYSNSIGRWRRFEKYLEPLSAALAGANGGD